MTMTSSFLLPYYMKLFNRDFAEDRVILPSIEFAFTNWAQSTNNGSGIRSQVIPSGIRRYTWADESLST